MNKGLLLATTAYLIWGFAALYWVQTEPVSAADLVAHRAFWSLPFVAVCLLAMGQLGAALGHLGNMRTMAIVVLAAALQAGNWAIFLWAVTNQRATEASLGYFLLPLVNVAVGIVVFKERLGRAQQVAVAFAVLAMLIIFVDNGGLPWVALGLSATIIPRTRPA